MTTKGQTKRLFILEKAEELFIQRGYSATSMEDLVQYSGVSKGSIYYYFKSKEELFLNLIEKSLNEWLASWRQKEFNYKSFSEKIYGITEHYVKDFQNPLLRVADEFFMSQSGQKEENVSYALKMIQAPQVIYAEIFKKGIDNKKVIPDSPEELSVVFAGLLNGLSLQFYDLKQDELIKLYNRAVSYFLNGIVTR